MPRPGTRRASTAAAATHPPPAKAARRSGVQPCHARSSPHSQEWRASHARNSRTIAFHSSRRSTARTRAAISIPRTSGMSALQLVAQLPPAVEAALEHVHFAGAPGADEMIGAEQPFDRPVAIEDDHAGAWQLLHT